jgi:signal transduction histidine kinase
LFVSVKACGADVSLNYNEAFATAPSAVVDLLTTPVSLQMFDSCLVLIDVNKFSQVLRNLINNAIKFTPAGGAVTVSARFEPSVDKDAENGFVVIEVADTGHGISKVSIVHVYINIVYVFLMYESSCF